MERSQRWPAFIAYLLPVFGWIYVGVFQSKNQFARFHLRQAIGLFLFLVFIPLVWALVSWLLAWIPYAFILGMAFFSLVMAAFVFGVIAWITGMVNALSYRAAYLPIIGRYSNQLPI